MTLDAEEFSGLTTRERKLKAARYVATMGRAPIDPDLSDTEAIEFLVDLYRDVRDADEYYERVDSYAAYEIADNAVPYNDYKAANAWAQLGLYRMDLQYPYGGEESGDAMKDIRGALYEFAYEYTMRMQGTPSPDYTDITGVSM